ncbi:polysaccharide pyruvyl transferase family protein [Salinibacter sp.]|uniref:polysaccharide pyruvyl transferase family protein n=1 Tax=Salinibacter sp. TaxID=2065818 RepID=UPI0021E717B2|nr:polysaccharide pyruvyl transferase family protein [Salinibacter sp.]
MLLAWDTIDRLNWGARGAHVATHQLVSATGQDIERISGEYQRQSHPINFSLPEQISKPIWKRRNQYGWALAYTQLESVFGAQADYLDIRPETSRQNILDNLDRAPIRRLYDAVRRHDTVVVDGNGDMIFKETPKRNLLADLALIELAHHLGKNIYYVNSIFADSSVTGRNETLARHCVDTLRKCDAVAFRDPQSRELYLELGGREDARCVPDSLFHWTDKLQNSRQHLPENGDFLIPYTQERDTYFGTLRFEEEYVCLTGGSRAAFTQQKASDGYCRLVERLQELDLPVYLVPTGAGDRFMYDVAEETGVPIVPAEVPILMGGAILANARLFVTGRYHPSIMAAAGGTPCVFLGADSHKTRSLQRMLGYDEPSVFSAIPSPEEHGDILDRCRELLAGGSAIRDRIQREAQARAEETEELATLIHGTDDQSR